MSNEKIAGIMRDFVASLEKKDLEKALSFLTEDATWVTPHGTYKGKEEIRRSLKWEFALAQEEKVTESGHGIMVQGDISFYEHFITLVVEGKKAEFLAMCAYEFKDDKIKNLRSVYDRLSLAKQLARGWLPQRIVNSVVKQVEKGLH